MWEAQTDTAEQEVQKITILEKGEPMRFETVSEYWRANAEFRDFYSSLLRASPFEAFFWEHPPVTKSTLRQTYEFVLVNSSQLTRVRADVQPFSEQFHRHDSAQSVIRFQNIGGDAALVVPRPVTSESSYAHFAAFLRNAPSSQIHELFMVLAETWEQTLGNEPRWLSTSGLGVYWLHIRIDRRPKYYTYQPYKQ